MQPTRRAMFLLLFGLPLSVVPSVVEPFAMVVVCSWIALALGFAYDAIELSRARVKAAMRVATTSPVGGASEVAVQLSCAEGRALRARVRTETSEPLVDELEARAVVRPSGTLATLRVGTPRRGRGTVDAVWVETEGPLGLVSRVDRFEDGAGAIDVVPDIGRVAKTVLEYLGAEPMLGGLRRDPWAGNGSEFESLQGYVQGMDLRGVDWKASARHHAVRVRRFHLERRQRVFLSIDAGRSMGDPIDGLDRIDHAAHTSLALARAALLAGDLVGLHAYADKPLLHVPPKAGFSQFQRLRRASAQLAVQLAETNHVVGLRDLLLRLDRKSFVVVFTEFGDTTTAELMIEVLGQLAQKHLVVFVALDDPVVEEALDTAPHDTTGLASAVVAATLGERRISVLARLSALGIHVIHTRPGLVAGRLIARYLEVKRRGLLG